MCERERDCGELRVISIDRFETRARGEKRKEEQELNCPWQAEKVGLGTLLAPVLVRGAALSTVL